MTLFPPRYTPPSGPFPGPGRGTRFERAGDRSAFRPGAAGPRLEWLCFVDIELRAGGGARNAKGQFTSLRGELAHESALMMDLVRDRVIELYESKRHRQPRTGRLVAAIADPRNRYHFRTRGIEVAQGFGNVAWLDKSQARYWRMIEYGSARVSDRWIGPMEDRYGVLLYGRWGVGHGTIPYRSGINVQKLYPFPLALRRKIQEAPPRPGRAKFRPYRRRHIAPYGAFHQAWEEVMGRGSQNMKRRWIEVFAQGGSTRGIKLIGMTNRP